MSAPAVLFAAIASAVSLTADDARLRREYARLELVRYLGKDASSSVVLADAVGTEGLGEDGFPVCGWRRHGGSARFKSQVSVRIRNQMI